MDRVFVYIYTEQKPFAIVFFVGHTEAIRSRKEGVIVKTFERFEFRLSEEDRRRLRALAEQTSRTESEVVRFLIRIADVPMPGDITPPRIPVLAPYDVEEVCSVA